MNDALSNNQFTHRHSGSYAFVFVVVITLMAAALVVWNVQHRVKVFQHSQQEIAETAALSASNEIELLISEKRRLVQLFASQHAAEISTLAADPDNDDKREHFEQLAAAYFPSYFGVTITGNDNTPLLADFDQRIGDVCLADIRKFAHNNYSNDLFVHPHPDGYHFDIMSPWRAPGASAESGVFFVSFTLDGISRLLRNSQVKNHTLLLIKRSDPDLIEVSGEGGRNQMTREPRLSARETADISYRHQIPGTLWNIEVLPDATGLAAFKTLVNQEAGGVMALFLLAAAIMLYLVGQAEHHRGRAEKAQMDTNRQLSTTIDNLRETQRQLIESEKLAALGSLVKGVAHEINTPLGVGVTAASHLQEEVRTLARSAEHEALTRSALKRFIDNAQMANQMLVANLDRASALVSSFKQVASDQSEELRNTFHLNECLDSVTDSLRPRMQAGHHHIELECPPDINMDSYPGALSQTITHLAVNALDHAFNDDRAGTLTIRCKCQDERVRIICSDDGAGIPPEVLARVFDPFVTTGRGQGRVGLGLHIAYNQVTAILGGRINCESSPGNGTRFHLDLPLTAPVLNPSSRNARSRLSG